MKKIGVMLIALLIVGLAFTSCGLFNPVKNTTWEAAETYYGIKYTYTLSFKDEDVTFESKFSETILGITISDSVSYSGTYEYKGGEVTGTLTVNGDKEQFKGTIDKDTMVFNFDTDSITFTKVDK